MFKASLIATVLVGLVIFVSLFVVVFGEHSPTAASFVWSLFPAIIR